MARRAKGKAEGLEQFLKPPVSPAEAAMWASLSVAHRGKAIQRIKAINRWILAKGAIDAKTAAADAGIKSVTRFYETAKAWREHKSLTSLGTFAAAPKTRVPVYDAAVRKVLTKVVAADPKGSVRKLALDLQVAIEIAADDMPGHNTLRRYVEEEKRRLEQKQMAGDEVMLDCSACKLVPSDDAVVTMFAILDRWTQVIFGVALGNVADSRAGYAMAASDALRRFGLGQFDDLPWVEKMTNAEVVLGNDVAKWDRIRGEVAAGGSVQPVQPSTKDGRFGRYLRDITGLRIGTVVVTPKHTSMGREDATLPTPEQIARIGVEVSEYNAERIVRLAKRGAGAPPVDLMRLLKVFSALRGSN